MVKNTIIDFIKFLKYPKDYQQSFTVREKVKFLFILLLFEIVFLFVVIFPIHLGVDQITILKEPKVDYSLSFLMSLLVFVIIIPLVEELIFRYFLRYKGFKTRFITRKRWDRIFPFLVYLLSIFFGFIHITNYENENTLCFVLSPLIILSQLVGGFIISFIRVRINFIWGFYYHMIWNFLFVIALPLIQHQLSEPYVENVKYYNISIKEKPFFDKNEEQILKIDSVSQKINTIEIKQYSLQNILDTLYSKDKYYVTDVLVNIDFKSRNGTTKKEFLNILRKEYNIR